jgi:sulfate/thiosulfate-binding protein
VLVVRAGNPKGIKDWDDLVKPGVKVITPNPKTSGGARWNYLAAWEYAKRKAGGDAKAKEFVARCTATCPCSTPARAARPSPLHQRGVGDVLIAWENEAHLLKKEFGGRTVRDRLPQLSILAEPPVTVVDKNVDKHGTRAVAQAYLDYLYTDEGQDLAGKHFYRPISDKAAAKYAKQFPKLSCSPSTRPSAAGRKAGKTHFADGGTSTRSTRPQILVRAPRIRRRQHQRAGRFRDRTGLRLQLSPAFTGKLANSQRHPVMARYIFRTFLPEGSRFRSSPLRPESGPPGR